MPRPRLPKTMKRASINVTLAPEVLRALKQMARADRTVPSQLVERLVRREMTHRADPERTEEESK